MTKYTIPTILAGIVMIAAVFAFMPVNEASTVHTTLLENQSTLTTVAATSDADGEDFTITCPATADACLIKEIYLDDDFGGGTEPDPGIATLDIDGVGAEAAFAIGETGVAPADGLIVALSAVANLALPPTGVLTIPIPAGADFPYTLTVVAEIEGNETLTVAAA